MALQKPIYGSLVSQHMYNSDVAGLIMLAICPFQQLTSTLHRSTIHNTRHCQLQSNIHNRIQIKHSLLLPYIVVYQFKLYFSPHMLKTANINKWRLGFFMIKINSKYKVTWRIKHTTCTAQVLISS